jgi:hypothetical protein
MNKAHRSLRLMCAVRHAPTQALIGADGLTMACAIIRSSARESVQWVLMPPTALKLTASASMKTMDTVTRSTCQDVVECVAQLGQTRQTVVMQQAMSKLIRQGSLSQKTLIVRSRKAGTFRQL